MQSLSARKIKNRGLWSIQVRFIDCFIVHWFYAHPASIMLDHYQPFARSPRTEPIRGESGGKKKGEIGKGCPKHTVPQKVVLYSSEIPF
jgi:hypothetical protein